MEHTAFRRCRYVVVSAEAVSDFQSDDGAMRHCNAATVLADIPAPGQPVGQHPARAAASNLPVWTRVTDIER